MITKFKIFDKIFVGYHITQRRKLKSILKNGIQNYLLFDPVINKITDIKDISDVKYDINENLKNGIKVYRIGKPTTEKFYVTTIGSKLGWEKYLNQVSTEITVSKLYIPNSDISFKSIEELQKKYDKGIITDDDVRNIYPEESGITNLEQYEVHINDIISYPVDFLDEID